MPLYQNSIIYKLVHCNDQDNENIYIGSTTNFRGRKRQHKNICCDEKNISYNYIVYQFIRDNDGWDNWLMIPVEIYPCESKKELEARERYWIEHFKSTLNRIIPTRTYKEWYEDNKEKIKENSKKYSQKNKEKIVEYQKEYHKNNKEKIAEQNKEYYEDNKEKINERQRQKVICECGCEITKRILKQHQRSKKHKDLMEQKESVEST